ncbi:MAG: hypothetical protein R3E75_13020 [Steroidobacteraceae bacterium]
MSERFEVGDHVAWSSEAGHVIEIKIDKTGHVAIHKGLALRKIAG